jgi:threonylcarbamoyladenosine tRNA methylthiotransferase MtaB
VHLGAYGEACEASGGLAGLLEGILHAYPELRVRLSSIHPDEITSELLAVFADHPHLRPHLHVSLQSGADSVLRRMRRPYSRRDAYDAISAAAALKPHFGLGADVIVGFPGETDSEFAATYNLIEELPFTYLHVFRFSARPGTPAASLPGQVEPETIGRRAARLRALAGGQKRAFLAGLIGSEREAVVESASGAPGWRQATTDNYAPVLVPDKFRPGVLLRLTPSGLRDGRLYAEDVRQIPRGSDPAPEVA